MGRTAHDAAEFHDFFARHYAELARLARLLTGDREGADDLAADALVALWHRWERVRTTDHPAAYARGVVANLARSHIRSAVRERRRIALFWGEGDHRTDDPDVPAVVDVQEALRTLPFRKRACVVLRHAFDLPERETALSLGISVGTVKSQTSKGMAHLERVLDHDTGAASALGAVGASRVPNRTVGNRSSSVGRKGIAAAASVDEHPGRP